MNSYFIYLLGGSVTTRHGCTWESEDTLKESVLSFQYLDLRNPSQVMFGGRCPYLPSHITVVM